MKLLSLSVILVAIAVATPANAQQARQQRTTNAAAQPAPPQSVVANKALARLKCHFGTLAQKACAKIGFAHQPAQPRS